MIKPCKNCGWIGGNVGCDTCGPPHRRQRTAPESSGAGAGSALAFKLEAGGKTYEGTVTVVEDGSDGPVTLPMLVNTLMFNIAKDCPELHDVQRIRFTARISKPNK